MPRPAPHQTAPHVPGTTVDTAPGIDALLTAWASGEGSPTEVLWGAVCAESLHHVAAGHLVPVVSAGRARWRIGPLDAAAHDQIGRASCRERVSRLG